MSMMKLGPLALATLLIAGQAAADEGKATPPPAKGQPAPTAGTAEAPRKAPAAATPAAATPAAAEPAAKPAAAKPAAAKPSAAKPAAAKPATAKPAAAKPAARMRLLDSAYTAALCKAWNGTRLPAKLGRAGSGWIDSNDSEGRQVIVINRRDCDGWKKVRLVIEADPKGNARCTSGGAYDGKSPLQWKFEPTTEQWADFSDGFGAAKMPGIMRGFEGAYGTAMSNIGNFEIFFAAAGKLALDRKVDWECKGADMEDVREEVADIDRKDMQQILSGD